MNARQRERAIELINNPPPGSKLAAAKEYGIDLTLLIGNLALTTTERLQDLCSIGSSLEEVRRAGERSRAR